MSRWCLCSLLLLSSSVLRAQEAPPVPPAPEAPPAVPAPVDEPPIPTVPPTPPATEPVGEVQPPATPGAQTHEERIRLFEERALLLKVTGSSVRVVRGDGAKVHDAELRAINISPDIREKFEALDNDERRHETVNKLGLGGCLGAPACFALGGGIVGAISFTAYSLSQGFLGNATNASVSGFVSGLLAGGCMGALVGVLLLPLSLAANTVLDALSNNELKPEDYARIVREHNSALARQMGLTPAELDPRYFPGGAA
ncbi:MAG: hypothetical protein AB2A00_26430 [Myxococcota bacterium]